MAIYGQGRGARDGAVAGISQAVASESFVAGQKVCVVDLRTRPELNGLVGSIQQWDEENGRWKVRMADGSGKMFKSANLKVIPNISDHSVRYLFVTS